MRGIIILLLLASNLIVTARTYYVAPNGNDSNPGTIDRPWETWGKAFNASEVNPGDTVYFRGGVYYRDLAKDNSSWYSPYNKGYYIRNRGTAGNYVNYWAYPLDEERPILDFANVDPRVNGVYPSNYAGISGGSLQYNLSYIYFKGLSFRNLLQIHPDIHDVDMVISNGTGTIYENCEFYNVGGNALTFTYLTYNCLVKNCDAWNCVDPYGDAHLGSNAMPGNDGTGFSVIDLSDNPNTSVKFDGCRAWDCSDQGFSAANTGITEFSNCWSWDNGMLEGGGHGFKLGWISDNSDPLAMKRVVTNCIAYHNRHSGFTTNEDFTKHHVGAMNIFNNTAYYNGYYADSDHDGDGFVLYGTLSSDAAELYRVFKNNVSYDNESSDVIMYWDGTYTHEYNSWDSPPDVTLTDNDFLSLDGSQLSRPRKADGSLPDINFLKLASTSDLIDAGTDVGLPYYGSAPDLGYSEYKSGDVTPPNQSPTVSINTPANNSTFTEPATIVIEATANDPDGTISRVDFYRGSTRLAQISSPPYTYTWQNVVAGSYSLTAVAIDNRNASTTSRSVNVVVNSSNSNTQENTPPVVSIYSPTKSTEYVAPATITIEALASDPDGTISKVEFYSGSTRIGQRTSSPYSFVWKNVVEGSYSIHVVATDNDNAVTVSPSIQVYVNKNQPPSVTILSPANNSTFIPPATITIEADAFDEDGTVSKVEFYNGDTKLGESTIPPFFYIWKDIKMGNYTLTVVAIDDRNAVKASEEVNIVVNNNNPLNIIKLYPNPNDGIFTIAYNEPLSEESAKIITIYSADGRPVYKGTMPEGELTKNLDLSFVKPGLYIMTLSGDEISGVDEILVTKKFIKNK